MGRKSRAKRDRREHRDDAITRVADGYSRGSMTALLEAATTSPTASHCSASLALVFESVIKRTRAGNRPVSSRLLPVLVDAAHRKDPELATFEDWIPYDPRLCVQVRWRNELFRLIPGVLERPVPTIDYLRVLARTIDPVLIEDLGYGLADVVELVLRRVDHVAVTLSPVWPRGGRPSVGDPPLIDTQEYEAARMLSGIVDQAAVCRDPERARKVLHSHSPTPESLLYRRIQGMSSFGTALAVRASGRSYIALPAAFLMEALHGLAVALSRRACSLDHTLRERWHKNVAEKMVDMLVGSRHPMQATTMTSEGFRVPAVIEYSPRQILVLDLVAELDPADYEASLAASNSSIARIVPGIELPIPTGTLRIGDDAEIEALQVLATPYDAEPTKTEQRRPISLEDLVWFARGCRDHPEDLWYYARDREGSSETAVLSVDEIDIWEAWCFADKTLFQTGAPVGAIFCDIHSAEVEWEFSNEMYRIESSLHALELPEAAAWPIVDLDSDATEVCDLFKARHYLIFDWEIPVAIAKYDSSTLPVDQSIVQNLADAATARLLHSRGSFTAGLAAAKSKSLRVELQHDSSITSDTDPLKFGGHEGARLTIHWGPGLREAFEGDPSDVERQLGRILSEVLPTQESKAAFLRNWDGAPPSIRFDPVSLVQSQPRLPSPIEPHSWHRSSWLHKLQSQLYASSIPTKTYKGDDAFRFESEELYPRLRSRLHREFDVHDCLALLRFALSQLECLNCQRWWQDRALSLSLGFPTTNERSVRLLQDARRRTLHLERFVSMVIDELLANPPSGKRHPDRLSWLSLLGLAELCVESSLRSEEIRWDLSRHEITLTDSYRLVVETAPSPDIDFQGYIQARTHETQPVPDPIYGIDSDANEIEENLPRSVLDVQPDLSPVDDALRREWGFGLDAPLGVYLAAQQWSVDDGEAVATTTVQEIAYVASMHHMVTSEEEYTKAVMWLAMKLGHTSKKEWVEHWKIESRAARIMTRPFVQIDENIYIMPWTSMAACNLFFSYLSEIRLPWAPEMVGEQVTHALEEVRKKLNDRFERDCRDALSDPRLIVRTNIQPRKADQYGLEGLTGEIDLLVIDTQESCIWVIEAKDKFTPHSDRSIARTIRKYHSSGEYVDKNRVKTEVVARFASSIAQRLKGRGL